MTLTATKRSQLRETRSVAVRDLEMRSNTDGSITFAGYASMTGVPYRVADHLGEYDETIERGAFTKALAEADDVRLLVNHEGVPLARTKSGTLSLVEDEIGLRAEAQLDPSSPLVQTIRSAMDRGDLDQMSFAFSVVRQTWSPDYAARAIAEVRLFDVSVVTYPASPSTSANLRAAVLRNASASIPTGRIDEMLLELRAGKMLSAANVNLLEGVLTSIRNASETITEAADELDALVVNAADARTGEPVAETRAGDPADINVLTQALAWFSAIDMIVDEAQEDLAAYLSVPNPDLDDMAEEASEGEIAPATPTVQANSAGFTLELARAKASRVRFQA